MLWACLSRVCYPWPHVQTILTTRFPFMSLKLSSVIFLYRVFGVVGGFWPSGFGTRCVLVRYVSTPNFKPIGVHTGPVGHRVTPRHLGRLHLPHQKCLIMYLRGDQVVIKPPPDQVLYTFLQSKLSCIQCLQCLF